jgi:hypothetical protein
MAAANYDILIEQGATFMLALRWKDNEGTYIDLTGYSARMTIRKSYPSNQVIIELSSGGINPQIVFGDQAGSINITIDDEITTEIKAFNRGVYDLELESDGGMVTRLLQGAVTFSPEVTR